jgi:hypothetical protein
MKNETSAPPGSRPLTVLSVVLWRGTASRLPAAVRSGKVWGVEGEELTNLYGETVAAAHALLAKAKEAPGIRRKDRAPRPGHPRLARRHESQVGG